MSGRWSAGGAVVLGGGTMGRGIVQLLLQAGAPVLLVDPLPGAATAAKASLEETFSKLHAKGRLEERPERLLEWLAVAEELPHGNRAEWVFEAAPEDLAIKHALFAEVERRAPSAYLATNTSTLSVTAVAAACKRPERVVGVHFFNPAPLMQLVEVVPGAHTPPELTAAAVAMARSLGRSPVVAQDRPGFIVNRLARPYYLEAIRLAAEGADVATVDAAMRATGFRMGPFELLDLIGLDVNLAASTSVYEGFYQEPRYRPHPMQRALVTAGRLGRKTGWGFYRYEAGEPVAPARSEPGAAALTAPAARLPSAHVLGSGPVAAWLRTRFLAVPPSAAADLVIDARVAADSTTAERTPDLTLCWARTAPAEGVGFSVVPPPARLAAESTTVELLAPTGPTGERVRGLLNAAGLVTLVVPDQPGGVAFRLVAGLINEAFIALAEGLADAATLDLAMRLGVNYPEGPLAWAVELGLADVMAGLSALQREFGMERYAPSSLLRRHVTHGTSPLGG